MHPAFAFGTRAVPNAKTPSATAACNNFFMLTFISNLLLLNAGKCGVEIKVV